MLSSTEFIQKSIEANLFWSRIIKEHATFVEGSLPPIQRRRAAQATQFRRQFARLLMETIRLANGVLPQELLSSGQFFTEYTEAAEKDLQRLTGLAVDSSLTVAEQSIVPASAGTVFSPQLEQRVKALNHRLLDTLIPFQRFETETLRQRHDCKIFFGLYPAALQHLINEGTRFENSLNNLQAGLGPIGADYIKFWNVNSAEHAKSIRGQLDLYEDDYFRASNSYAEIFTSLSAAPPNHAESLDYTEKFASFGSDVTKNTLSCQLMSIMSALYADHLTREVNHFVYLLNLPSPSAN